ncbi:MAG: enoyl-CoA hydratase/isomerase family protein [Deltaproteobacteria bacterium]|nr:enoyl-CoA hydratase/isomerase family protein [Deltaproteobacteria bacterium]MBW2445587.1 enoyl-CoA hydratase/isomerase family protein [Deltaproteobacteria bacterium]
MEFETLLYDVVDGVATITLNRPKRHNAFNLTMANELKQAWDAVNTDGDVVCAIVTGAGEKAFCTGMDVADVASGDAPKETAGQSRKDAPWFQLTAIQNKVWKPVITAVNGMCCGGGLHFIADSDLILAADNASFFDTHVKVGLIAGLEPVGLARRIPLEAVLRMAFLGGSERLGAAEAKTLGLVGEVLPAAELLPRARELAGKIAQHSPTALARSKQCIWESLDAGLDQALGDTWDAIVEHSACPDLEEGSKAFVEKRKPRWVPYTG